jgi:long-chain acyl-CoA synthetase
MTLTIHIEWLVTDLALSKINVPSFTITSLELLAPVLEHYPPSAIACHADLAVQLLEIISDANEHAHHQLIVIGQNAEAEAHLASQRALKTHRWEELVEAGKQDASVTLPTSSEPLC